MKWMMGETDHEAPLGSRSGVVGAEQERADGAAAGVVEGAGLGGGAARHGDASGRAALGQNPFKQRELWLCALHRYVVTLQ